MEEHDPDRLRVAFGPPNKGYHLHRFSPSMPALKPGRTACGSIIVRGLDSFLEPTEHTKPCEECEQVIALYDDIQCGIVDIQQVARHKRRTLGLRDDPGESS